VVVATKNRLGTVKNGIYASNKKGFRIGLIENNMYDKKKNKKIRKKRLL
jgi:hypothetical protein